VAMRFPLLLRVALAPLMLAHAVSAGAQTVEAGIGNRSSLSLFRFWTLGGPTGGLRLALISQGFGDTIRNDGPNTGGLGSGVFGGGGPTATPAVSRGPQTGWVVAAGYRFTQRLDVELNAHRAVRMAEIFGFNRTTPARVTMHTTIGSGGLTAGLSFGGFRVAAGPMYYHTHVQTEESGGKVPAVHSREGALGALFGAGFVVPAQNRIQFHGRGEFRLVGGRSIGTFEAAGRSGDQVGFSPGQINFNHGVLMLGVTVRP
jgi:hypothetical protein